jgi:hypothetical protein
MIPYYGPDIKAVVPLGRITLQTFLERIRRPSLRMQYTLDRIREAADRGDEGTKAELKKRLYFFTPAIDCTYRNYQSITQFNGLAVLDFDKLPGRYEATELKKELFHTNPEIIAAWLSTSRHGCRALLRIPVVQSVGEYKAYFHGFGHRANMFRGYDIAPQNPVLPLFFSDDSEILTRMDAKEWRQKYQPPPPTRPQRIDLYDNVGENAEVYEIVKRGIDRITDNGHPQLRACAYALGGYVKSGYLTESEAVSYIDNLIRYNAYLGTPKKVDGYIRTAKEMIIKGQSEPIKLRKDVY